MVGTVEEDSRIASDWQVLWMVSMQMDVDVDVDVDVDLDGWMAKQIANQVVRYCSLIARQSKRKALKEVEFVT